MLGWNSLLSLTVWLSLQILSVSQGKERYEDIICTFPQEEEPRDILKLISHHPHIRLNLFYWNLAVLGINIVSLSMPSQLSDYLQLNFGAECEPVREMSISTTSAEYTEWLKKKYSKKKNLLERGTQCTISYDVYESLLQHQRKLDDYQNEINVFILDTGISSNHTEFDRYPEYAFDAVSYPPLLNDPHGHGTQLAGLIAGRTVGVAPQARLIDVRVVGADGLARVDDILAGLDYIAGRAISHNEHAAVSFGLVSVVCLSLTGEFHSLALNSALKLVSSVVTIISAAGDNNKYACSVSPASSLSVIVAAATSRENDLEFIGSNYGECIHIFAPGENLLTSSIGTPDSMVNVSGSSASAAIVTAIWASLLQVYSEPENLRLKVDNPQHGILDDPILADLDRVLLLKDSLLHPTSGYFADSSHEIPWLGCEFSTPESVLRHMNHRFQEWVATRRTMKKFLNPHARKQFLASQS